MKRILKWTVLVLGALVLAAICFAFVFRWVTNRQDARAFPMPGKLVPLGPEFPTTSLHIDCSGSGSPTVIFESGLGVPAVGWYQVQPGVAAFTRVCSYDRAGYGWSTPGTMPRTTDQIVKELHALLAAAGEKPPYVLVAHSFGGFNVRVYTSRYPDEVAGLVLVDTSHEDQNQNMPPSLKAFMDQETSKLKTEMRFAPLLIDSGLARLTTPLDGPPTLPVEIRKELRYLQLQPDFVAASASEMMNFNQSADEVRQAGNLGDRPLLVLTAGKMNLDDLPKTISREELDKFHDTWIHDLQVRETHLSTNGTQIVVADSDHMIPIETPQVVVQATKTVVDQVRRAGINQETANSASPSASNQQAMKTGGHPHK